LLAFGTDNQAAKAAEDYRRGQANPVGVSAAPVSEVPKVFAAPCREANAERHGASMVINRWRDYIGAITTF